MDQSGVGKPRTEVPTFNRFDYQLRIHRNLRNARRQLWFSIILAAFGIGLGSLLLWMARGSLSTSVGADILVTLGHSLMSATLIVAAVAAWYGYRKVSLDRLQADLEEDMRVLAQLASAGMLRADSNLESPTGEG